MWVWCEKPYKWQNYSVLHNIVTFFFAFQLMVAKCFCYLSIILTVNKMIWFYLVCCRELKLHCVLLLLSDKEKF